MGFDQLLICFSEGTLLIKEADQVWPDWLEKPCSWFQGIMRLFVMLARWLTSASCSLAEGSAVGPMMRQDGRRIFLTLPLWECGNFHHSCTRWFWVKGQGYSSIIVKNKIEKAQVARLVKLSAANRAQPLPRLVTRIADKRVFWVRAQLSRTGLNFTGIPSTWPLAPNRTIGILIFMHSWWIGMTAVGKIREPLRWQSCASLRFSSHQAAIFISLRLLQGLVCMPTPTTLLSYALRS